MAFVRQNWLNAETASVVTDPEEVSGATQYGLQVEATGSPSGTATLEGSIDGINYTTLVVANVSANNAAVVWTPAAAGGFGAVLGRPAVYIRLNLSISGGSSPTVSASVIAV